MLFNSLAFIFVFLPAVLLVYYGLALSRLAPLRRPFLIVVTLVFYAIGAARFLPVLLASVAFNWLMGAVIERVRGHAGRARAAIVGGVTGNVLLLGYFKYFSFLATSIAAAFGSTFRVEQIAFPLGISFFTFIQIGYLIDVSRGRMKAAGPLDYASFALFFPQLIAGPLVQYKETAPQLGQAPVRNLILRNIVIGLVIFAFGLFKKAVIADTAALYAGPVFAIGRSGGAMGWLDTWVGALCYTAQIYFDFSGYSDMAIGVARMLGILMPLNFHSPLRATSVVEIWRRWHVTLGRWVLNYVFQPVAIPMARVAARCGVGKYGNLILAVVVPTMASMLILGIWHGAGWTFVVFGLMQGAYMATNEAFALIRKDARKARKKAKIPNPWWHRPLSQLAVVVFFVFSQVPFGSPDMGAAMHMWSAMLGAGPLFLLPADWPLGAGAGFAVLVSLYAIMFVFPNTQEIMARFEPVLEWSRWRKTDPKPSPFEWRMTPGWAIFAGLVLFLGVAFIMRGTTNFIYMAF